MTTNEELKKISIELSDDEDTQKDKFLTFKIGKEDYAIEIKFVNEIFGIQNITKVPNVRDYIKGIINLRGMIVPVIDIRNRFKLEQVEYDDRTCIIVVNYNGLPIGLIVDEVSEVLNLAENQIAPPPQTNKGTHSRFIQGIGKDGEDVKIILNIRKLLYDEDKSLIDNKERKN